MTSLKNVFGAFVFLFMAAALFAVSTPGPAGGTLGGQSQAFTQLVVTPADAYGCVDPAQDCILTATAFAFEPAVSASGETKSATVRNLLDECKKDSPGDVMGCMYSRSMQRLGSPVKNPTFVAVQNAKITFMYRLASGAYAPVDGCVGLTADIKKTGTMPSGTSIPTPIDYYVAQCKIPKSIREGQPTTEIKAVSLPAKVTINGKEETAQSATYDYVIRNPPSTAAQALTRKLGDLIAGIAQAPGYTANGATLPCVGVFLILGLLLASLYFTGKSPVSLLDITTPRLPSPKGVAAGGQVLTPFGWSELKGANLEKLKKGGAFIGKLAGGYASTASYNRLTSSWKSMLQGDKEVVKGALSLGQKTGASTSDLEKLARKSVYNYGNDEHKIISEIFKNAQRLGGKDATMASVMKGYVMDARVHQSLEAITGHAEIGKRSAVMAGIDKALKPMMNVNRYAIVGPVVTSGAASLVRSWQVGVRGTKAAIRGAPIVAGEVAKTTAGMIGGKRAAERMALNLSSAAAGFSSAAAGFKSTAAGEWLSTKLGKHPGDIKIGTMYPITEKLKAQYKTTLNAHYRDVEEYVLQQGFKAVGVRTDFTHKELMELGYKNVDILRRCGLNTADPAAVRAVGAAAKEILSNMSLSHPEKIRRLIALMESHGARIDKQALAITQRLEGIEHDANPEYLKMGMVQTVLNEENRARMTVLSGKHGADAYVCNVGTESLDRHGHEGQPDEGPQLARTMIFGTMIWDCEHGYGRGGIQDWLVSFRLNMSNRCVGLDPVAGMSQLPEFMQNKAELEALAARNKTDMISLFTEEGRASFQKVTGKSMGAASMSDIVGFMYGGTLSQPGADMTADKSGHMYDKATGQMIWFGTPHELSLPKEATLVDVKRHWIKELDARENFALGQWVESRFTKSYVPYYDAGIEATLDRMQGPAQWSAAQRTRMAKELLTEKLMTRDLQNRFNSQFGQNCYGGTTSETARFYGGVLAGVLEKALLEKGMEVNHRDLAFLQKMNVSDPSAQAKLNDLMGKYKRELEGRLFDNNGPARPVTYNDLVRSDKAMVMLHEGGLAYYHKGMVLSDLDRVLGGEVALRDDKGQSRAFRPEDVTIRFSNEALQREFERIASSKNPEHWESFLKAAKNDTKAGGYNYEKEKVFAAVLWQYATTTWDYAKFWNESAVSVQSKRQTAPVAPSVLRFFGVDSPGLSKFLKPWRDIGLHLGDYVSTVALAAGGMDRGVHQAAYDIAPLSEMQREQSWRNAQSILSGEAMKGMTSDERTAARAYAMTHFGYHQAWDYAIDRNPWGTSTSFGAHQAWGSFFHFGPAQVYSVKDNLRAFMDKGQYANFMSFYGFPMDLAGKIMRPYTSMMRGLQMSMQGYAGKFDATGNALAQWNYTQPRIREAMQSVNPFSFKWFSGKTWDRLAGLNTYGGSLEKHQLAGRDFTKGLLQAPQDIYLTRKGVYSTARTDEANPGISHYDYRHELRPEAKAAEYAVRMNEGAFMYDERIREAAFTNTTRRTVSAEALAMRRNQELYSFGIMQNQMFSMLNPLMPLWHGFPMGGPSPKDIVSGYLARSKTGGSVSFTQKLQATMENIGRSVTRAVQPHMLAHTTYCPRCGTSNYRGSTCRKCRQVQY